MDTRGFAAIIAAILLAVSTHGEPDPKPVQVDYYGIPASQYPSEAYRYDPRANNYAGYTQVALTQYNPLLHQLGGYYLNTPYQQGYEAPEYAVTESPVAGRYDYDGRGGYVNRPLVRVRPLIYNNIDYPAKTPNTYSNNNYPNYYQRQQGNGYVSRPYYDTNYNGVTRNGVAGDDGRYYQGEQGAYAIRGGVFPTTDYDSTNSKGRDYRLQNGDSNAYYQNHRPNYNSYSYENSRHSGAYSPQIQSGGETRGYYNDKDGYDANGYEGRKDGFGAQQSERTAYTVSQPRRIVPVRGVNSKEPQALYPAKREDKETKTEE